jgi:FAD dependent oxidoreductase
MRTFFAIAGLAALFAVSGWSQVERDLVVYGGTAGGIITAVSAAREGLKVTLLEPGSHLGGMATGGLSRTDFGKKDVIGGYPLEFYWRVGEKYDLARYAQGLAWYYEPHVGEQVFVEMLRDAKVEVLLHHRLREHDGVSKAGGKVVSLTTENGSVYSAKIFADCSYEGDLMAQAGVSYTWGRESSAQYGENLAGVRDHTPFHQFLVPVNGYDDGHHLLPEISALPKGETGAADKRVQSYNFRMILTDNPANRLPFPKPANYDPKRYELLARLIAAKIKKTGRTPELREFMLIARIPNGKADFNNNGPFSTDFIGHSWNYPDGSYAEKKRIWDEHIRYTQGFFYFMGHDPRVPKQLRDDMNAWGFPKDESTDLNHWPHQLYIREARRMVGDFVMTQKDLQTELTKPDAIGMGSYNSDSHNIQRVVTADGNVENEGDMQVGVKPYQIPYRVMLPKPNEAANLLVPVCFSASHVAYSSVRMEPQYMILGEAAGVAAAMSIKEGKAVQAVNTHELSETLLKQGAVLEYHAQRPAPPSIMQFFHESTKGVKYSPEFFQ